MVYWVDYLVSLNLYTYSNTNKFLRQQHRSILNSYLIKTRARYDNETIAVQNKFVSKRLLLVHKYSSDK